MIRGNAVLTQLIKTELMAPRRDRVTKSPRKDATGGAMLSEDGGQIARRDWEGDTNQGRAHNDDRAQ